MKQKKRPSKPEASNGLSETDIHYLVAFLYTITHRDDIMVIGDKISDVTTGTKRDVDIVITKDFGMMGIEVKDEGRKVDVTLVEQICQKLSDMPDIKTKVIVSSSDYTDPARKKAAAHGVQCLRIIRGPIPPAFQGVDFSAVNEMAETGFTWSQASVRFVLEPNLPSGKPRLTTSVTIPSEPKSSQLTTLNEVVNQALRALAHEYTGPSEDIVVTRNIEFKNRPVMQIRRKVYVITGARLSGTLHWVERKLPSHGTWYLADEKGEPFLLALLFEKGEGLLGLASSSTDKRVSVINIPAEIRKIRPIRRTVKAGKFV